MFYIFKSLMIFYFFVPTVLSNSFRSIIMSADAGKEVAARVVEEGEKRKETIQSNNFYILAIDFNIKWCVVEN